VHGAKPVVTLVNGPAAGAGLSLALLGDVVLSSASAHFTAAYGFVGLTPDGGMSWLLPGWWLRRAQEIILTNRRIGAQEAQAIGLVTRVVENEALLEEGMALAHTLAAGPTAALGGARCWPPVSSKISTVTLPSKPPASRRPVPQPKRAKASPPLSNAANPISPKGSRHERSLYRRSRPHRRGQAQGRSGRMAPRRYGGRGAQRAGRPLRHRSGGHRGCDPLRHQCGRAGLCFARNAVLASRLPQSVPAVTVDRQCGSSQQCVQFAAQAVMSGTQDVVIAAGGESMTRVPMFSNIAYHESAGVGIGPFSPRILDRFGVKEFSQFAGAEMIAAKYGFDRETLDRFALQSHQRAHAATQAGPSTRRSCAGGGGRLHRRDEGIRADATLEGIGAVKLLQEGGVISAANASQICDGARACWWSMRRGSRPMASNPSRASSI
jgi:hypothetical protein